MLPAVEHNTAKAKVGVGSLQAIEAISPAIATLVAFGNKGAAKRGEVRAILIRGAGVCRAHMALRRATAMADGAGKQRSPMLKVPDHKSPTPRVARQIDKEGYLRIIALRATIFEQPCGARRHPTSQAHCAGVQRVVALLRHRAP